MGNKTPFPHKKWKSIYDDLITAILTGKSHTEAAAVVGIGANHVSRLFRWPPFMKEFRRRRAIKVEEADAWLQAASGLAAARQLEILNLNRPYVMEFTDKTGKVKKRTVPPNFHLVLQAASEILRAGRERSDKDVIISGIDELKQKAKKRSKE